MAQVNISNAAGSCGRSQIQLKYLGKYRTGPAAGRRSIHILQASLRAAAIASAPAESRLGPCGIPISAIGVAPAPAANALCGVRPAAAEFAAAPPCIRRDHPGDPQGACRGASADYRVEQRLLLRIHLLVTAVAVSGMHRAVLNQFAQPRILGVESAHALEVIDLCGDARRSDSRSIHSDGRGRMYSLECFHSPRLRAPGAREPCFRAQNSSLLTERTARIGGLRYPPSNHPRHNPGGLLWG
jgi:hypothetical protein